MPKHGAAPRRLAKKVKKEVKKPAAVRKSSGASTRVRVI